MEKLNSWLWLLVALVWILGPGTGISVLTGTVTTWIAAVAVAIIGAMGLKA